MAKRKTIQKKIRSRKNVVNEESGVYQEQSPANENLNQRLEIRVTTTQQQQIEKAAMVLGYKNTSDYIRQTLLENSQKVARDQAVLEIAERDRERFVAELTKPGPVGSKLKQAIGRFRKSTVGK